jgi:hypothetical protein
MKPEIVSIETALIECAKKCFVGRKIAVSFYDNEKPLKRVEGKIIDVVAENDGGARKYFFATDKQSISRVELKDLDCEIRSTADGVYRIISGIDPKIVD